MREGPTDAAQWESVPDTLYEALVARLRASETQFLKNRRLRPSNGISTATSCP